MSYVLQPFQEKLKQDIYGSWYHGCRNVLGVLPTGGGKSVVSTSITSDKLRIGERQAIIAHRNELVSQMSLHVGSCGIPHRIIGPQSAISQIIANHRREFQGHCFINPDAPTTVAGVDTIISRYDSLKEWGGQIDRWTIDEAHHLLRGNKWGKATELFPNAWGLGLTASPGRADGKGLGRHADGLFDYMALGPSTRELMDIGAITDYEYVVPASDFEIDESAITESGDFSQVKMREASKKSHIVGDVVKEYINRAFGKRAIVFATDVETAGEIAKNFQYYGIQAAAVSGKTPATTREEYVRRFKNGSLTILINVDLFGEGFDVPACEVVIMARPTASLSVYLQQCGRALRKMLGKLYGLIIDHVSNWKRHGFPDKKRFWTLDRREKRAKRPVDPEEVPLTVCRSCSRPYERVLTACPRCGAVPEISLSARGSIEHIDGDLILLDREKLAQLRAATELETPASVGERVWYAVGSHAAKFHTNAQIERIQMQQRLSNAIANWAGLQRALGRDDQQSYRRFYLTLGVNVLSALALSRVEMEKLAETVEGWLK